MLIPSNRAHNIFLTLILLIFAGLFVSNQDAWSSSKRKPTAKIAILASSKYGTLQVKLTEGRVTKTKLIKAGAVRTVTFNLGTKVAISAKAKTGYKTGIILNGEMVKYEKDKSKALLASAKTKVIKPVEQVYTLPKLSISATKIPLVEARFIARGTQFARNAAIVFSGLGGTIRVTNKNPASLTGTAACDVGVKSVGWVNKTTGTKGNATGTKSWLGTVPFALGDNKITANLNAKDGTVFSNDTTITYFPEIDFNTPLKVSDDVLFVGVSAQVTFNIGLGAPTGAVVTLIETDSSGAGLGAFTSPMLDNGVLPDEIDRDGLFTTRMAIDTTNPGYKFYRAKVEKAGQTYYSETRSVWITTPYSSAQIQSAVDLANNVQSRYDALIASHKSEATALATILKEIQAQAIVGAAGLSDSNAIWWITKDGILGGFEPPRAGQKGGGHDVQSQSYNQFIESVKGSSRNAAIVGYYTQQQLDYVKLSANASYFTTAAAQTDDPNRSSSHKSVILSPFIANPNSGANFGNSDDYFGPWQTLVNNGSICSQKADKAVVNNGAVNVTLADFQNLSDYGFIHFSTHGNNLYNGLLSNWKDEWGPNGFLKGYYSIVVLASGVYLPKLADGTFDSASVSADLKAKRVAIFATGNTYMLPEFFSHYVGGLPKSIVFLSACRASYNSSMADVFLAKGANAVFGYTDYVASTYAQNTGGEIYTKMIIDDKTVKEAFDSAVSKFGASDADADPAALTLFGNNDAKRHAGELSNGGFEDGKLTPWARSGDGRLISGLGDFSPVEGSYMGIVSTGLGYTTTSGILSQAFCLPTKVQTIDFSWNYSSEEFLEWCNSIYQDTFSVDICELDPQTEAELSCNNLMFKNVKSLCSSVSKVDFSFDRGDVYSTGWLNASLPIPTSLAGKSVKVKFSAGDVGDSIYDTAVLIDAITVPTPTP